MGFSLAVSPNDNQNPCIILLDDAHVVEEDDFASLPVERNNDKANCAPTFQPGASNEQNQAEAKLEMTDGLIVATLTQPSICRVVKVAAATL